MTTADRTTTRRVAALLVGASLALAGCGGGDKTPAAADASASPQADATAPGAPGATGSTPSADPDTDTSPAAEADPSAGQEEAAPTPKGATNVALKRAAQQYATGLLRGDYKRLAPYLDSSCTDSDRAGLLVALGAVKKLAKGATMTVTGVRIVGKRGNVTTYTLSAKAPAELRQVLDESLRKSAGNPWRYAGGGWKNTGPCSGGSAVPDPGSSDGPTRTA